MITRIKNNRKDIPIRIQREILFKNEAVCCICQKTNIQIHHIDGNNGNNKLSNLCALCIEHHAQASSKSAMLKGLSSGLLRKFKSDWEGRVARKRGILAKQRKKIKPDSDYIKFELKRLIYYLPTINTKKEANRNIDQIYYWCLLEGFESDILKNLAYIQWFFSGWQKAIISERLYELFWQYVDPKEVPLRSIEELMIIKAIELLGDFGSHEAFLDQNKHVIINVTKSLEEFFRIGIAYRRKKVKLKVLEQLNRIKKEWLGDKTAKKKKTVLNLLTKKINKLKR